MGQPHRTVFAIDIYIKLIYICDDGSHANTIHHKRTKAIQNDPEGVMGVKCFDMVLPDAVARGRETFITFFR